LFLGGWLGPVLPGPVWFILKTCVMIFIFIWIRGTYPRMRYDHIMKFGWKFLFPAALANVVITAFIVALR